MIRKVEFKNFKALSGNEIKMGKLTVLAGLNSAGKSSVIQGILLIKSLTDRLKFTKAQSGTLSGFPLNGSYLLSLGSTSECISKDTGKEFSIKLFDEGKEINTRFFTDESLIDTIYDINVEVDSSITASSISTNTFYYLNAERLGPRIRHWINEKDSKLFDCGYRGEYAVEMLARTKAPMSDFVVSEKKWLNKEKLLGQQDIISYVGQWMKFITPGTDIGDATILGKIRSATFDLNGNTPPNVGFGISYVLPIIVTGLMAEPGSIFIVENPEAHLHPKGQSNIGYFLGQIAASGVQVLIETHSEHVINGIRKAALTFEDLDSESVCLHFFKGIAEDRKSEIIPISISETSELSDFPIDFFDQVRQDLVQIRNLISKRHG